MPSPQGTVLSNLDNTVFNKGYVYGTRYGGSADPIEFGALQNVRFADAFSKAMLRGPESLSALAVGITEENLTFTYSYGVLLPEQLIMALGGSQSYDAGTGRTTYTKLVNQEPQPFDLHFKSGPEASPDLECRFYRCVVDNWNIVNADNRAFSLGEGSGTVHGEANGGRLFTYSKPGDLTNSS